MTLAFVRVINNRTNRILRVVTGGQVSTFNRLSTASALAALSISAIANGQQAPGGEEVETVVVTGVREALSKGLENKKENTQVIESIVAEDIGKLPDNNVIE